MRPEEPPASFLFLLLRVLGYTHDDDDEGDVGGKKIHRHHKTQQSQQKALLERTAF